MAEYIEREALLNRLEAIKESADWDNQSKYVLFGIKEFINNAPAAAVQSIVEGASHDGEQDVVAVVRCKNCKHYQKDMLFGNAYCDGRQIKPDDFCSYGERRDTDG